MANDRLDERGATSEESFLTLAQAAKKLAIDAEHLRRYCQRGWVQGAVKKAGHWCIPANAKLDFLIRK